VWGSACEEPILLESAHVKQFPTGTVRRPNAPNQWVSPSARSAQPGGGRKVVSPAEVPHFAQWALTPHKEPNAHPPDPPNWGQIKERVLTPPVPLPDSAGPAPKPGMFFQQIERGPSGPARP